MFRLYQYKFWFKVCFKSLLLKLLKIILCCIFATYEKFMQGVRYISLIIICIKWISYASLHFFDMVKSSFGNFLPYCDKRANCWHLATRISAFLNFTHWGEEREEKLNEILNYAKSIYWNKSFFVGTFFHGHLWPGWRSILVLGKFCQTQLKLAEKLLNQG